MADTVDGPDEHADEHADEPGELPVMHAPGAAKKLEAAARRAEALRLLADGVPQTVIAARLGVSQPRISAILKAELARAAALRIADVDLIREQESAKLDTLESQAVEALEGARLGWQRSLTPRIQRSRSRRKGGGAGEQTEVKVESEARPGDPRFLGVIVQAGAARLRVAERRARLNGLDKPSKVALTDPDGDMLAQAMEGLSPAVLADLHRRAAEKWAKAPASDEPAGDEPAARIEDPDELRRTLYKQAVREALNARRAGDKEAADKWTRIMRQTAPH